MSVTLMVQTLAQITNTDFSLHSVCAAGFAFVIAGCLLVGFLTPIVAIAIAVGAICLAFFGFALSIEWPFHSLLQLMILSAAILFLGPGAFSFDARMFGRREIRIP